MELNLHLILKLTFNFQLSMQSITSKLTVLKIKKINKYYIGIKSTFLFALTDYIYIYLRKFKQGSLKSLNYFTDSSQWH